MNFKFKQQNPNANKRKIESDKIKEKYPERIPIICERASSTRNVKLIDKSKYLVPRDLTVSQFSFIIRKRLELSKEAALFLLVCGKHSITGDTSISEIYEMYSDKEDGFLYISYTSELTWG
jgi:GABA(A) receptor-associated protein